MDTAHIRPAHLGDVEGIAKVHIACWKTTYTGIIPQELLDKLSIPKRTIKRREILELPRDKQETFVSLDANNEITGFVDVGISREPSFPYTGEMYAIYLLKEKQGSGIGRVLFETGVNWLRERNHPSMFLWVLKENSTLDFYKHMGGTVFTSKLIELKGKQYEELGVGWDKLP
jgi:GNAT superfamily N-acetyltransferase